MSHWLDEPGVRHDVVTIPKLWVTIAASVLIHLAILFIWIPRTHLLTPGDQEQDRISDRLQVRLDASAPQPDSAAAARLPPPPVPAPPKTTVARVQRPQVPAPSRQAPTIIARPAPPAVAAPPPAVAAPPPPAVVAPPPPAVAAQPPSQRTEGDLAAYIEARRRERGEQQGASDSEAAQFNRAIAANLPAPARGVAAQDTKRGGGIFQIKRMTYDDAAFEFYGWNTDMGRRTPQLIEVRKGDNADMRIAVVRRMIAIIRQFEKEDFTWQSPQKGTTVVLSARLSDNAALERYLMHEFFDDARGP